MCITTVSMNHEDRISRITLGGSSEIRIASPDLSGQIVIMLPYGVTSDAVDKIIAAFNEALAPRREEIAQKIRELV